MKTFVVNLPTEKKRLESITHQLNKLKIPFEVFPAVCGRDLTKQELESLYDSKKANDFLGKDLTPGEIGCALSHIGIFKKIVNEKIDLALVLEDDVLINKNLKNFYNSLCDKKVKWDYLSLYYENFDIGEIRKYHGYIYKNYFKKGEILTFFVHFFGMLFFSVVDYMLLAISGLFGTFVIKKYKAAYSTCGYFISYEGAKKLLKIHDKVFIPSDYLPEKFGKYVGLNFSISVPRLIDPGVLPSCIDLIEKRN